MIDIATFKQLALSFNGTEEVPHFDRLAFKIIGRKIFATLLEKDLTANLLLTPADQSVYCLVDKTAIYAVPNKWGLQGWTTFDLRALPVDVVSDALLAAYNGVLQGKPKRKK